MMLRRIPLPLLTMFHVLAVLQKSRVQVWLFEQSDLRIEGVIIVSTLPRRAFSLAPTLNSPDAICGHDASWVHPWMPGRILQELRSFVYLCDRDSMST